MTHEIHLSPAEAASASAIQQAIDSLGIAGGRIVLPEMELALDRGIELRSNVELAGQGPGTLLRKTHGRIYPLSGYHNYGMHDVPLEHTEGLEPGMTVAVRDKTHRGFFETFARITWIDGNWVGLDCGLHADYHANQEPELVTAFPLVYGLNVENVALRNLALDGNREQQPAGIGACRGAAIYFIGSRDVEVSDVQERWFFGEGLGFQICRNVRILRCRVAENTGNGYHPGAGSTAALFEDCLAEGNGAAGFFFCVRANHITVRNSAFRGNHACGISVGTRDCYNRIADCQMTGNAGPGLLIRRTSRPVEVHSCHISGCRIESNASEHGHAQVDVQGDAHDLVLERNEIAGLPDQERAGIYLAPSAERIWLIENEIKACAPQVIGAPATVTDLPPRLECGVEGVQDQHYRHLL
jgi:polygalacturonase